MSSEDEPPDTERTPAEPAAAPREYRRRSSVNAPGFAIIARTLAKQCAEMGLEARAELATRFADEFERWPEKPPPDEVRRATINALADLHRETLELVATLPRPPKG